MPGGLLNLVSVGSSNIILNGNPKKTFFTSSFKTYTNFGLQKFRIDFNGQRSLRLNDSTKFSFKIPRYGDLLMDTCLVINLPTIWSPIIPMIGDIPATEGQIPTSYRTYDFKWIENLGTQMIESIEVIAGGQTLQKVSGQYLYNLVERDWDSSKKQLYYDMTGNVSELNDPANTFQRNGNYPNAIYNASYGSAGPEPSIRSRQLYIPLNLWFGLTSKQALPLVAVQYNEISIEVTLRPIVDLFVIRNVNGSTEEERKKYVRANQNENLMGFYRFLHPPPSEFLPQGVYSDTRTNWNADCHLIGTYGFLSEDEVRKFAALPHKYLISEVYEHTHFNNAGSGKVKAEGMNVVKDWMWFFQRTDVKNRNEWSNYTNWDYNGKIPQGLSVAGTGLLSNIYSTGVYNEANRRLILDKWSIQMDGKYREDLLPAGIYEYMEPYSKSTGNRPIGLYEYSFALNTNPYDLQPSGGMNLSKFKNVEFEFVTYQPPMDSNAQFLTVCDPETGLPVAVNKPNWSVYNYTYNLHIMEERYNVIIIESGQIGLEYAR